MEGHATEAMVPSMSQEQAMWSSTNAVKTAMMADGRKAPPAWASILIAQSTEEIAQLKGEESLYSTA